jgi:predicted small lipoprotein YifL
MGGGIKKMIKIILQILTMVTLAVSEAKGPLF